MWGGWDGPCQPHGHRKEFLWCWGTGAARCVAQVGRSSLLVGALHKQYAQELLPDKLPPQDNTTTTDSDMEEPYLQGSAQAPSPSCPLGASRDFPRSPPAELAGFSLWVSLHAPQNPKRRGIPPS